MTLGNKLVSMTVSRKAGINPLNFILKKKITVKASPMKKKNCKTGKKKKCLEEQWPYYAGKHTAHEINVLMSTRPGARGGREGGEETSMRRKRGERKRQGSGLRMN